MGEEAQGRSRQRSILLHPGTRRGGIEMRDCVFCRIVAGELPAHAVFQDDLTLAFMDAGQVNPGHVIVAVKDHVEDIFDLSSDQAAAAFQTAHRVAKAVKLAFEAEGLTILQANGKAAWQTVPHFHLHVLPRAIDDGVTMTWPTKNPPPARLAEYAARIDAKWDRSSQS
jgi:histidine triad (HIT) family protein